MDWTKDFTSTPVNPCHDLTKFEVSKTLKMMLESIKENDCVDTPGIRMAMVRAKIEGEDELRKVLEFQLLPLSIEEEKRRREVEKKKQYEIYQKEKEREEQLERDRIEKEQLERDRIEKAAYRYRDVFHICSIKNLRSIIEKGLFSRVSAPPGFEDIANKKIVKYLRKEWIKYASTYFEPINAMYYAIRHQYETVIVEFRIDLSKSGIVITDGNAAVEKRTRDTNFYSFNFVEIMKSLDELKANPYRGAKEFQDESKYEEQKRMYQAECLVPNKISRDCIKSIQIAGANIVSVDYGDIVPYVDDLIANSGLSIKRKIMYYHSPPRIIREAHTNSSGDIC